MFQKQKNVKQNPPLYAPSKAIPVGSSPYKTDRMPARPKFGSTKKIPTSQFGSGSRGGGTTTASTGPNK